MPKIRFYPFSEETESFAPAPAPAGRFMPDWYRSQVGIMGGDETLLAGYSATTVKKCMPIFDLITAGYIIVAPCDIFLDATNPDKLDFSIPMSLKKFQADMFASHGLEQYDEYPLDQSIYHKVLLRVFPFWSVGTEKGYSTMFMQPTHRDDSPLTALSAIVDTDKFLTDGHLSFLVRKDFKGVIKQGTPLVQIFPFQREAWESEIVGNEESERALMRQRYDIRSTFSNSYKNKFRSKKEYK